MTSSHNFCGGNREIIDRKYAGSKTKSRNNRIIDRYHTTHNFQEGRRRRHSIFYLKNQRTAYRIEPQETIRMEIEYDVQKLKIGIQSAHPEKNYQGNKEAEVIETDIKITVLIGNGTFEVKEEEIGIRLIHGINGIYAASGGCKNSRTSKMFQMWQNRALEKKNVTITRETRQAGTKGGNAFLN